MTKAELQNQVEELRETEDGIRDVLADPDLEDSEKLDEIEGLLGEER